jgi:hypothetical protein
LSYLLHGHVPYYKPSPPHPDPLLHGPLQRDPALLRPDLGALTALTDHFAASRRSYSTQALPINVLLDALVHPLGELDVSSQSSSTVEWRFMPDLAVSHVVLARSAQPGGLWADEEPVPVRPDLATLSYAPMLSLPGYSFADHHRCLTGTDLPPFNRPARRDVTAYLRAYPAAVGIQDIIRCNEDVNGVERTANGFYIRSHSIHCRHLVLATGVFSQPISPPALLLPLTALPVSSGHIAQSVPVPLLVIGSGFTAADVILSVPLGQPILHLFRWDPENRPTPLHGCHPHAYPEYAGIYRLMKHAVLALETRSSSTRSKRRQPVWTPIPEECYEGGPNAEVTDVQIHQPRPTVTIRRSDGSFISRSVCGLVYAVGRRGSLSFLEPSLRAEVMAGAADECGEAVISSQTLRSKMLKDLEVAPNVFAIGGLTGDSLIRFAYGGCVYTAARVMMAPCDAEAPAISKNDKRGGPSHGEDGSCARTGLPLLPEGGFWTMVLRIMRWAWS